MEEKLQLAIYKIDHGTIDSTGGEDLFSKVSTHILSKSFASQKINWDSIKDYQLALFYKKTPSNPKWKTFFKKIADNSEKILKENQSWNESFILLLLNKTSQNLYAITWGLGFHIIQEFIDEDFGVDVLSRLITKDDKILKSVKEKAVMGGILGTTKFFRKNYNLAENDSFGKIYQELEAFLDKNILQERFGFSLDDLKKWSTCFAKTSFKINKSITFDQLFQIITWCEYVLENPDNDPKLRPISINNVEKIVKKRNPDLIQKLEKELLKQLWSRFQNESEAFDFDICHRDFEKYLTATKFIVRRSSSENNYFWNYTFESLTLIDQMYEKIKEMENAPRDEGEFINLIRSLKIYSYDQENDNQPLTHSYLINHIFWDITCETNKYFLIDNAWYRIKENFIFELNESCTNFIVQNFHEEPMNNWDYANDDENAYNSKYISNTPLSEKILVFDKITPENIEPCDILRWSDKTLYFYHVKAGFSNTMRDLCSQIFIAATRIQKDLNWSKEYIWKIYDELSRKASSNDPYYKKAGKQLDNISKADFLDIFNKTKLVFVLCVFDTAVHERDIKNNIADFWSNIAKFSLQELIKGMKGIDIDLQVIQIAKG